MKRINNKWIRRLINWIHFDFWEIPSFYKELVEVGKYNRKNRLHIPVFNSARNIHSHHPGKAHNLIVHDLESLYISKCSSQKAKTMSCHLVRPLKKILSTLKLFSAIIALYCHSTMINKTSAVSRFLCSAIKGLKKFWHVRRLSKIKSSSSSRKLTLKF